jgi:predicted HTH domain antitoxin
MSAVTLDCAPELGVALGKRPAEVVMEVKLMAALKLYESGRISSGLAAKLAGLERVDFLFLCGQYGVTVFQQTPEEISADAEAVLHACHR